MRTNSTGSPREYRRGDNNGSSAFFGCFIITLIIAGAISLTLGGIAWVASRFIA